MKLTLKDIPTKDILIQQNKWTENNKLSGGLVQPPLDGYIEDFPYTYEAFPKWPEKLIYKKMEKLVDEGLLEYGVSLRTAWLTPEGKDYLNEKA